MSKLILTRGIPASGKTSWAKAWVAEEPDERVRINRDTLRELFGVPARGTFAQEEYITKVQRRLVQDSLAEGKSVVIDDTNLRAKYAKDWLLLARAAETQVEFKDFPISQSEAIYRDAVRMGLGERGVGKDVIADFYSRYCTKAGDLPPIPVLSETEQPRFKFEPYVQQNHLPWCVIVDIDGTLAHMNGRSPYDPTLYHTDAYDPIIGDVAMSYAQFNGDKIILMSGRDEQYREATERWLYDESDFTYNEFYMRPQGDTRNDAIVKNELFEKHIAGKYNVSFVLDDRDRVVAMWRAKGLKVLQVAEGDF